MYFPTLSASGIAILLLEPALIFRQEVLELMINHPVKDRPL